jgi:RND family efflux transporter MFP subunit
MTVPLNMPLSPSEESVDDTRRLLAQLRGQGGGGHTAGGSGAARAGQATDAAPAAAVTAAQMRRRTAVAVLASLAVGAGAMGLATGAWGPRHAGAAEAGGPSTAGATAQPAGIAAAQRDATQAEAARPSPTPMAAPAGGVMLEASGFVVARRQATVSASQTGRLARLFVKEGAHVRRGDLIAELDAGISRAEVAYAEAGVLAAERAVEVTRRKLEAARRAAARDQGLARDGFISAAGLDQSSSTVATLQAQLEAELSQVAVAREQQRIQTEQMQGIEVRAPFDGIVTDLAAHEGEIVSPISGGGGFTRTGICTIIDPASLEGEVDVNERYLERLHAGQAVAVHLPAFPSLKLMGTVATLPAVVDRNTAAARIRIAFPSPAPELRPGMRADFSFGGA